VAVDVPMQAMQSYAGPDTQNVTIVGKCQNASGSWGESDPIEFKYDATAPADVTGAPLLPADHNGWYNAPLDIQFGGTDATSGIDTCSLVHYAGPDGIDVSVTGFCEDMAGNTSAPVSSAAFDYDNTDPQLTANLAADGPIYLRQPVEVTWVASDNLSGVDGDVSACPQPDTSQVGPLSLTCEVWDLAGNGPAAAPVGYSVIYRFEGFFHPVRDGWNEENAGRTLPIKWRLADYYDVGVDGAAVSMAVTPVSCTAEALTPYAGSTDIVKGLQPQQQGNYHYNWQTDKDETGCVQVVIDLQEGPGNEHVINIMWK
jgi:hypothetical protein